MEEGTGKVEMGNECGKETVALGTLGLLGKGILANKILAGVGLGMSALSIYLFFTLRGD